ncbi:hypothetical protein EDC01DRAFT_750252 [Geopyxis carbonaria]|nr:hypothetical protein EDC01DRAFT_750252 [Geopyxis carbonaria]
MSNSLATRVLGALLLLFTLFSAVTFASPVTGALLTPRASVLDSTISVLKSKLSVGASIVLPDEDAWDNTTSRWSEYSRPLSGFAVLVSNVRDVQETVKFAKKAGMPFLVRNRGHGSVGTLATFQGGIEIEVSMLNSIKINKKSSTATMGGGVYNYQVIQTLYAAGYQGAVGSCSCVGFLGAGLGGGHGRLQGMHGLIADGIVSAQVVLGDGRLTTASATKNKDLWWALKGAGHNFGVVVEVTYKIYPLVADGDWWYANFIYGKSQIEDVFALVNKLRDSQPAELTIASVYTWLPGATEPNIIVSLFYPGHVNTRAKWTAPFAALGPLPGSDEGVAKWKDLSEVSFTGLNSTLCAHGYRRNQYPVGVKTVDATSAIAAFELFAEVGEKYPDTKGSTLVFESYSLQAVRKVKSADTAYPHRDVNVIILFQGMYTDPTIDEPMNEYGKQIRNTLRKKSGFSTPKGYLNYAQGDEPLEVLYGDEAWRMKKLRSLKKLWDPKNAFGFYEPLA